jgi:hypothetical protein
MRVVTKLTNFLLYFEWFINQFPSSHQNNTDNFAFLPYPYLCKELHILLTSLDYVVPTAVQNIEKRLLRLCSRTDGGATGNKVMCGCCKCCTYITVTHLPIYVSIFPKKLPVIAPSCCMCNSSVDSLLECPLSAYYSTCAASFT